MSRERGSGRPVSERYLFSVHEAGEGRERRRGGGGCWPVLLLDFSDREGDVTGAAGELLEWRVTLWSSSTAQRAEEVRLPLQQDGNKETLQHLFVLYLDSLVAFSSLLSSKSDTLILLAEVIFRKTGQVYLSGSQEFHLVNGDTSLEASNCTQVFAGQTSSISMSFSPPRHHPIKHPNRTLYQPRDVTVHLSLAFLPPGVSLYSLTCKDLKRDITRHLWLLHPLDPSPEVHLVALRDAMLSLQNQEYVSSNKHLLSHSGNNICHRNREFFESTAVSVEDIQFAQDLHDFYDDDTLVVSACFVPASGLAKQNHLRQTYCKNSISLLGTLSSSTGDFLRDVHVPRGRNCLHMSNSTNQGVCQTSSVGESEYFDQKYADCLGDDSRYLMIYVSTTEQQRSSQLDSKGNKGQLPSSSRDSLNWEVCAGIVDLHMLLHSENVASDDILGADLDSCFSVERSVAVSLTAAPLKHDRMMSKYVRSDELATNDSCDDFTFENISSSAITVGKIVINLKIIRLLYRICSKSENDSLDAFYHPSMEVVRLNGINSYPYYMWTWDTMRLSDTLGTVIDALVTDPATIAAFLGFDIDSACQSNMNIDTCTGWASSPYIPLRLNPIDDILDQRLHLNKLNFRDKCILLSVMAEIVCSYPDLTNFVARLSIASEDPINFADIDCDGTDMFFYFFPVIHHIFVKDIATVRSVESILPLCASEPPLNVVQDVIKLLQCNEVLVRYVESWLECNIFAELIADPFFLLKTTSSSQNTDLQPPPLYNCKYELSRSEECWETLLSVCWCVCTVQNDTEGMSMFYRQRNEASVSAETISTHLFVSILHYGITVLSDTATSMSSHVEQHVCILVEQFIDRICMCIGILIENVLSVKGCQIPADDSAKYDDWSERSSQILMSLALFFNSVVEACDIWLRNSNSKLSHCLCPIIERIFARSQLHMLSYELELIDSELFCLRSGVRCLSSVIMPSSSLILSVVNGPLETILSQIAAELGEKLSQMIHELPRLVNKRKTNDIPAPPRARVKKHQTVNVNKGINMDKLSEASTNTTAVKKEIKNCQDWLCFGECIGFSFDEKDYQECLAQLNSIQKMEDGEVDELGFISTMVRTFGDRCSLLRDIIEYISSINTISLVDDTKSNSITPDTSKQVSTSDQPADLKKRSKFSRLMAKRSASNARNKISNVEDKATESKTCQSSAAQESKKLSYCLQALAPLEETVDELWTAFLGGVELQPHVGYENCDDFCSGGTNGDETAGSTSYRSNKPVVSEICEGAFMFEELSVNFREVAYLSAKFHAVVSSLRKEILLEIEPTSSHEKRDVVNCLCPLVLSKCSPEELVLVNLNANLYFLCDLFACKYSAVLQRDSIGVAPKNKCNMPSTLHRLGRDTEKMLLIANCLYIQASVSPLLTVKSVTNYVLYLLGLSPEPRHSGVAAYNSVDEWCCLWYNVCVCNTSMLLATFRLMESSNDGSRDNAARIPTVLLALIELLQYHCSLNHLLNSRPDLVAACMQVNAHTTVALLFETTMTISKREETVKFTNKKTPEKDIYFHLWAKYVGGNEDSSNFAGKSSVSKSNPSADIIHYIQRKLLHCCVLLMRNCVFLSTDAFSLPVRHDKSTAVTTSKKGKSTLRPPVTTKITISSYLSPTFSKSVVRVMLQQVRACILDNFSSDFGEIFGALLSTTISPSKSISGDNNAPRVLLVVLRNLKMALLDGKRHPEVVHCEELICQMGMIEARLHLMLYGMRSLLTVMPRISEGKSVEREIASSGNPHQDAFRSAWVVATVDTLLRQQCSQEVMDDGVSASFCEVRGVNDQHLLFLEQNMTLKINTQFMNKSANKSTLLSDLRGGAWKLGVLFMKLAVADGNLRKSSPILDSATENFSSPINDATWEAVGDVEKRHQITREILQCMLRCGEWVAGKELAKKLLAEYSRAILAVPTSNPSAVSHFSVSSPKQKIKLNSIPRLSALLTRTQFPPSKIPSRPLAEVDNSAAVYQIHAVGKERLQTFCKEIEQSTEFFNDRLRHEGSQRCLPVFYAIRFVSSPWETLTDSKEPLNAVNKRLRELVALCGYSFVSEMDIPKYSRHRTATDSTGVCSNFDASVGIQENEVWMLLKYDASTFCRDDCDDGLVDGDNHSSFHTDKFAKNLEANHGPLGSYTRLAYQVAEAFPEFTLKSNATLFALPDPNPYSSATDVHSKVIQIFEAFPNVQDCESTSIPPSKSYIPSTHSSMIYAKETCHSTAFASAVIARMDDVHNRPHSLSSLTVRVSNALSSPSRLVHTTHPSQHDVTYVNGINNQSNSAHNTLNTESQTHDLQLTQRSPSVEDIDEWERCSSCESFVIHTCLHLSRYPTQHSNDAKFTVTMILSTDTGRRVLGNNTSVQSNSPSAKASQQGGIEENISPVQREVHQWSPCRLVFVSSTFVFPSLVTHGYCILQNHLLRLKHCEALLLRLNSNTTDALKRADSVSGFFTIVRYVVACMSNLIGHPDVSTRDESPSLMGLFNARIMLCGEEERRSLLWQSARRTIKHDHMTKKSNFDKWVRDTGSGPMDIPAPPPPQRPSDLDVSSLENEFKASLHSTDDTYLAALFGVDVMQLPRYLNSHTAALVNTPSLEKEQTSANEELNVEKESKPAPALQQVTLLHEQAIATSSSVLKLLRDALDTLPDNDNVILQQSPNSEESLRSSDSSDSSATSSTTSVMDSEDSPPVKSVSTKEGWLHTLRWLEYTFFSLTV